MPKFRYILVVKGEIEARNKTNAHLNILMGTTLSARLISSPHEIALELRETESRENGRKAEQVPPFVKEIDGRD
jgi:hypothetical protein